MEETESVGEMDAEVDEMIEVAIAEIGNIVSDS